MKNQERRIYLRPMTEEDTDLIVNWRNNDEVRKRFVYQERFTRETHLHWIETKVKTGKVVQMMICLREDDRPIGSVYIRDIDHTHHKGEYGIFIGDAENYGKGYGTEAAKEMLKYAFENLQLHRLYLRLYADNERAKRSYEKVGFIQEALLREDVCIDGAFRDMLLMGILRQDYERIYAGIE